MRKHRSTAAPFVIMRYAAVVLAVASLAATIEAHALKSVYSKRATALEVTLASSGTGGVGELVATIKNAGPTDLNLLKVGTLLDETLPVQKVLAVDEAGKPHHQKRET